MSATEHPDWALAYVLQKWKRETGPVVRKAYRIACANESAWDLIRDAAYDLEGMARSLRSVLPPE